MLSKFKKTFIILFALCMTNLSAAEEATEGRLVSTSGEVYINGQPAKAGDIVPAGAKVETAPGATASVIFGSDSVVNFSSNSVVTVDSVAGSAVTVSVQKGAVDGVKKMGTASTAAIVVKTDSATFTLNSGRYVVGRNESSTNPAMSYVSVDGDAVIAYTKDTRNGQKAGDTVQLAAGSFVTVRPAKNASTEVVATTQKVTESQSNDLRPSQQQSPSTKEVVNSISQAIVNPETPATPEVRGPASNTGGTAQTNPGSSASPALPSWNDAGPGFSSGAAPGSGISRDPLQPLPGKSNPNVNVIFEP
ncbi:MAG: hypothetical protein OM95_15910 [Bdellovibrio sp. ArHS]|uniref:hypothetical protein n=1 Tax=Bdellovibrio sp. ArHS TaxID=1569284 RepID=UPI0005833779|nr:hypothetical protein [Bdellovibrio sp. ArHS]KHD87178.1 MAG: hypothetical protein OM95_15910 [Bdellovibrio sp. ArHS]